MEKFAPYPQLGNNKNMSLTRFLLSNSYQTKFRLANIFTRQHAGEPLFQGESTCNSLGQIREQTSTFASGLADDGAVQDVFGVEFLLLRLRWRLEAQVVRRLRHVGDEPVAEAVGEVAAEVVATVPPLSMGKEVRCFFGGSIFSYICG